MNCCSSLAYDGARIRRKESCGSDAISFWGSQPCKNMIVLGVRTDPEPNYCIALTDTQRPPTNADAHRIDWISIMDAFELQAGMVGIAQPKTVCVESLALHRAGQSIQ